MRSTLFVILGLATLAASGAEARPLNKPAPLRQAGTLTCVTDPSFGFIVGSTRAATCTYVSNYGRFSQVYAGRLSRVGFDVGLTSGQMISWRILTPGGRSRAHMLNGLYGGSSAEATLLVGPGSQYVYNDRGNRILIEPIGHSGQAGFDLGDLGCILSDLLRIGEHLHVPVRQAGRSKVLVDRKDRLPRSQVADELLAVDIGAVRRRDVFGRDQSDQAPFPEPKGKS